MNYDPRADPMFSPAVISKLVMERLRLAQMTYIGPQMMHDMDVRIREGYLHDIIDQLIFSLETYLTVRARMTGTEDVPFSTDAHYSTDVETFRSPWQERKPSWFAKLFPRKMKTVHAEGTTRVSSSVTIERKVYDAFPQSSIIWPDKLGQSMVMEVFEAKGWLGE